SQETMAIVDVTRLDAVDIKIDNHGFLCFRAEGAEDRLQRAHPTERTGLRRSSAPAHGFRPWEVADRLRHQFGDDFFRRAAGLRQMSDGELTLLRIGVDIAPRYYPPP